MVAGFRFGKGTSGGKEVKESEAHTYARYGSSYFGSIAGGERCTDLRW